MVVSKILLASKSAHGFCSNSFASNWLRLLKLVSWFSVKVSVSRRFHLAKFVFHGWHFIWSSQVSEIGFKIFSKSFGKFGSGFFARFIFSGKVNFSQSQFFSKGFSKFLVLRFGKRVLVSMTKSGL